MSIMKVPQMMIQREPAVAELNKAHCFEPLKYARWAYDPEEKSMRMYLDLKYKILWFRLLHPVGLTPVKLLRVTGKEAVAEASISFVHGGPVVATATAQRSTTDKCGNRYIEEARRAALDQALTNAGFGIQYCDVAQGSDPVLLNHGVPLDPAEDMAQVAVGRPSEPPAAEAVTEEPPAAEAVAEEPAAAEAVAEEPAAAETVAEEPAAAETVAEEPAAAETVAEEPAAAETVAEEPPVAETVAEEPPVAETVTEEPPVAETVAEEPPVAETVTEEPVAAESVVKEPPVAETVAMEDTMESAETQSQSGQAETEQTARVVPISDVACADDQDPGDITPSEEQVSTDGDSRYAKDMPVKEILKLMTADEAAHCIIDVGFCKGKTLGMVLETRPATIRWLANSYNGDNNILRAGAQLLLSTGGQPNSLAG